MVILLLIICLSWTGLVAYLLLRAGRQYASYEVIQPMSPPDANEALAITVVIPARNEAQNITRCLDGLRVQTYPREHLWIVVVDDRSTDATVAVVSEYDRRNSRITLLRSRALPAGWTGKSHACHQGVRARQSEWICFLDADTQPGPDLLSSAVRIAQGCELDMLSLEPFQEMRGFWERLILPAGFFLIAFSLDIRKVNDPARPEAAANGQFLLIRRTVYEAVGGHASVKDRIAEDGALAQRVKHAGYRLALLGAEPLIRVRMYRDLPSLWEGLSKNTVDMLGSVSRSVLVGVGALLVGWLPVVMPLVIAMHLIRSPGSLMIAAMVLAGMTALTMLGVHLGGTRHFQIPLWYGLLFPLGYTCGAGLVLSSALKRLRGEVTWKGRTYSCPGSIPSRGHRQAGAAENR